MWKENFMLIRILLATCLLLGCSSDVSYSLVQGGSINLTSPGKVVVINYWAIWCTPCRKEIPELNELAAHNPEKLTVVGVNFDESRGEKLLGEIEKLGIEFPSLVEDPRSIWGLGPVTILPETLIISAEGKLLHRLIGPQTLSSIEALLK
jgi:thiol-disulfide isomerase/thioredoxin